MLCCWLLWLCLLHLEPLGAAEVDKMAVDALQVWDVPGLALVVVKDDETLVLKGYGKREQGKPAPITPDTIFPLASCTKAFTSTLLAILADDEAMGWDDPVRKHLPAFKLSDPNADALLTMRDLLCHRCGIGGHDLLWYRVPWNIDEIVKRAQRLPLDYPFRGGYRYSSIPVLVAGRAIEKRTGKRWEDLVRERICEPLGMTGITFTTTAIPRDADRASGHRTGKNGKVENAPVYEIQEPNPSGSVNATARDLSAWLKFHLAQGVGPDGRRLVSMKNLGETHTPQNMIRMEGTARLLNPDSVQLTYGMGWLIYDYRGKKVLSHGGLIDGFKVQLTLVPEDHLAFAVLCNLHDSRMTAALTNSLIDLYCKLPARDWNAYYLKIVNEEAVGRKKAIEKRNAARDTNLKASIPLSGFAGEYQHPAYGAATVTEMNGKLNLAFSTFTIPLEHFEGNTFRVSDGLFEEQLIPFTVSGERSLALKFAGQEFTRK